MRKNIIVLVALPVVVVVAVLALWFWSRPKPVELSSTAAPSYFASQVEPLLHKRCLACHGCYSSPCQLNFQSADGTSRGALKIDALNGTRLKSVAPTRLGIDAHGKAQWQTLGFFDVTVNGIMRSMLELKQNNQANFKTERADRENRVCPSSATEMKAYAALHPEGGMPYGLPALAPSELDILTKWLEQGGKTDGALSAADLLQSQPQALKQQLAEWQKFFNDENLRQKLVSRYIFEHLFLAHIYFSDVSLAPPPVTSGAQPRQFFRLVRSRSTCESGVDEITTPRPNDDPGVPRVYYCLLPLAEKIVEKNHMAFSFNSERLKRWQTLFLSGDWQVKNTPSYESRIASNPFQAFQDIPAKTRYQFLLDDARYHVSTFIKGPVCNGSNAVNSIQEQFYVFFLDPEVDPLVKLSEFARKVLPLLELPGGWGRDINVLDLPFRYHQQVEARNTYRKLRVEAGAALRPSGYSLKDVWDGEGTNPNAVLTVLRHNESAYVMTGARGDLSKTVLMVDYSLLERLVYNLVVNFDVFANVGHQFMTRTYMTLIRMEAEELFLQFLPSSERKRIRSEWYQGPFTTLEMTFRYPLMGLEIESGISFQNPKNAKAELVNRVLFERMNAKVRGASDAINWRVTRSADEKLEATGEQSLLRELTGVSAAQADFPKFFPDLALLEVVRPSGSHLYSIVGNKETSSLAWILQENNRRAPWEDSLVILEGLAGSYPNIFFRVTVEELAAFKTAVQTLHSDEDWRKLVERFGVPRTQPQFWARYDQFQALVDQYQGVESGVLDLIRYE